MADGTSGIMTVILTWARTAAAVLAAVSLFGATAVFSGTADSASSPLLSLLRRNYGPEAWLSAKFTLTVYWSVREKEEKKQGRIWLAPGDRFRVTIDEETYVSDGKTLWHYSAGTRQLVVKRLSDVDPATLPSQVFARHIASCPFREAERKKGIVQLEWKSDTAGARYREIRASVREKNGRILRGELTDKNGNISTYDFTSMVMGEKIAEEKFVFDAPEKARIVDMRD